MPGMSDPRIRMVARGWSPAARHGSMNTGNSVDDLRPLVNFAQMDNREVSRWHWYASRVKSLLLHQRVGLVIAVGLTLALAAPASASLAVPNADPPEPIALSTSIAPADETGPKDLVTPLSTHKQTLVGEDPGEGAAVALTPTTTMGLTDTSLDVCWSQTVVQPKYSDRQYPQGFATPITVAAWGMQEARLVTLEIQVPGGWWPVGSQTMPAQVRPADGSNPLYYKMTFEIPASLAKGEPMVRATLDERLPCTQVMSPEIQIKFVPAVHTWSDLWIARITDGVTSRGATAPVELFINARLNARPGAPPMSTTFAVERRVGKGAWTTMKSVKVKATTDSGGLISLNAKIPRFSKSLSSKGGVVRYRFVPAATESINSVPSGIAIVKYFNARSVAKKAIKKKCPSTPVTYRSKPVASAKPRPGQKIAGYVMTGENRIYLIKTPIYKDMTIEGVRQVAYHECGHVLQYKVYAGRKTLAGGGWLAWEQLKRDALKVFGGKDRKTGKDAIEHMADCVAEAVSKRTSPSTFTGYGGKCTKKHLKAAKRLLHGKRIR